MMVGKLLALLIGLIKLPVKLVLLPFKIVSVLMTVFIYAIVLAAAAGVLYLFVL